MHTGLQGPETWWTPWSEPNNGFQAPEVLASSACPMLDPACPAPGPDILEYEWTAQEANILGLEEASHKLVPEVFPAMRRGDKVLGD